jgi:hypothetical protein
MTARSRRTGAWAVVALTLSAVALVLSAFDTERGSSGSARGAAASAGAGIPLPDRAGRPARVAYAGPRVLRGHPTLRVRIAAKRQRIVAVTYLVGSRPLGTATAPPYALDADVSQLPAGRHRLRVVAVDRLGRRETGRPVAVRTRPAGGRVIEASPQQGLSAALDALARGRVTVRLAPGRYALRHVALGSGARLSGSGPGTVLTATRGGFSFVTARGRGIRVSDLAIDGAGRAARAIGVSPPSRDVRLQRLDIRGIRESGVEIWGPHADVSVQDSTIAGEGARGGGVMDRGSDESRGTSVIRSEITGFRGYGINFFQRDYDRPAVARNALALDNQIADIDDPAAADGTHEGGIWSGGVGAAIIGNRIRDTGWDGIQTVGSSRGVTIVGNDVARTMTGIYLEHETTRSLIAGNAIADVHTGINSEWRYDGAGSGANTLDGNTITRPTDAGIFIDVAGDHNRIGGNVVVGGNGPAVVLQGASDNLVTGTVACARGGERMIVQQSAHYDDGRAAHSLRNRIEANGGRGACPGA